MVVPFHTVASPIMAETAHELCKLPSPLSGVLPTVRGRTKFRLHHHFPNQHESCFKNQLNSGNVCHCFTVKMSKKWARHWTNLWAGVLTLPARPYSCPSPRQTGRQTLKMVYFVFSLRKVYLTLYLPWVPNGTYRFYSVKRQMILLVKGKPLRGERVKTVCPPGEKKEMAALSWTLIMPSSVILVIL